MLNSCLMTRIIINILFWSICSTVSFSALLLDKTNRQDLTLISFYMQLNYNSILNNRTEQTTHPFGNSRNKIRYHNLPLNLTPCLYHNNHNLSLRQPKTIALIWLILIFTAHLVLKMLMDSYFEMWVFSRLFSSVYNISLIFLLRALLLQVRDFSPNEATWLVIVFLVNSKKMITYFIRIHIIFIM